ncbi:MAG: TIGR01777 family oxidoreductase [Chlamydiia bacterium]|nr:TIGR01777 family oxidoreductase [Chlamydiia bacterium]
MKILVAGSSGFVGQALVSNLREKGFEVVCLVRRQQTGCPFWDPVTRQVDSSVFEAVDGVINLSGENILGRWNQSKMEEIRESRFRTTSFLVETLLTLDKLPKVYINASAIGYYGDRGEEELTESSTSGHGYLAEVCRKWEALTEPLVQKGVRVCLSRFGLILGKEGGALKKMLPPFQMGMGGVLGNGNQFVSWIDLHDAISALIFMIENEKLSGPINVVSPHPITNRRLTEIMGAVLNKPTPLPIPRFMLSALFGSGVDIFLASTKALPKKLEAAGFTFSSPDLASTLKKALSHIT